MKITKPGRIGPEIVSHPLLMGIGGFHSVPVLIALVVTGFIIRADETGNSKTGTS